MTKSEGVDPYYSVAEKLRGGLKLTIPEFIIPKPRPSQISLTEVEAKCDELLNTTALQLLAMGTIGLTAEIASLGQVESVTLIAGHMISLSGLPSAVAGLNTLPIEIGLKIPAQRYWNMIYQPRIPDAEQIAQLRVKGFLTREAYIQWMAENGYALWAADLLTINQERAPGISDLLTMLRRGLLDYEGFMYWAYRNQLPWAAADKLAQLRWVIPSAQDIISIYVKEGYLPEKWAEVPEEFIGLMEQQGLNSFWAKRIWGQHWVLPGVNLLYDMFHKEIISYDTMVQMLKYHDFEPVWRDRLILNAYNMIPRVDLRRAYRYSLIPAEGLTQRYKKLGYAQEDATVLSQIAQRASLDVYYSRLQNVAKAAFRKGRISEDSLRWLLKISTAPSDAIELVVMAEKLARETEILDPGEQARALSASQILSLYEKSLISWDIGFTRLQGLGYTSEDASLLLSTSEPRPPAAEVNTDLVSAAAPLFRQGLMSEDEFRSRLRGAGMTEAAIQSKVEAEELRYRLDFAQDLIAMFKQGYEKDVYTAEELENSLLAYGMQPERAAALVALEQLKKLPKPKRAA